jgi:glycosyltransferase involved in cell wall biosynthesis
MKVAVHNAFFREYFAETELARRLCIAGENLGWEIVEFGSSGAIEYFKPDFVLALHFQTPKLTSFPTYGCMWNPTIFFEQYDEYNRVDQAKKNILSYDGYLSSSDQINTWLKDILYRTEKKHFICSGFYTSCHQIPYQQPQIEDPNVAYIGTNWDGWRYQELFEHLDKESYTQIYGPSEAWEYLRLSYKKILPFDGVSVTSILNQAGIGLCLHKEEHINASVPSMRIFEIVASGALAICSEHPFIRRAFGDSVFYLDSNLSSQDQVVQISGYVKWISDNRQKALEMSLRAHQIFMTEYSLENLLLKIVPYHQKLISEKGFVVSNNSIEDNQKIVEIIVRAGDRNEQTVQRCLDSIANQTYFNIRIILVVYRPLLYLDSLITKYKSKLEFKIISSEISGFRSTQLMAGLNAVSADYFGILDDDDIMYPNHICSLINILDHNSAVGVAYSGSVRTWESEKLDTKLDSSILEYFEPFDINRFLSFDNFIVSNSFLARAELLDRDILEDPLLEVAEDLFLLVNLCRKTKFLFSYEATCRFYWRSSKEDNSRFIDDKIWKNSAERLRNMFWKKDFPQSQFIEKPVSVNSQSIANLQIKLNDALNVIKSMESTKFWKLRQQWFKLKTAIKFIKLDE